MGYERGDRDYRRGEPHERDTRGNDDQRYGRREGYTGLGRFVDNEGDRGQRDRQEHDGRPRSYGDDSDRGFFDRAGDEVRSWFGDEDAERRRARDGRDDYGSDGGQSRFQSSGARYGQPGSGAAGRSHDPSYSDWRQRQIDALDRDYEDYRRENQTQFDSQFGSWRTKRTGQRDSMQRVTEHMEIIGRDGEKIGTVDKVRGDRIILTKSDAEAGGHHHSIPCSWIESVDDRVTVSKSADEAMRQWRDEERQSAMFGGGEQLQPQGTDRYARNSGNW